MDETQNKKADSLAECERLLGLFSDTVYRVARSWMKNPDDADDVFQDVFVSLVRYFPGLRGDEHAKAWLIRTTINRCKKLLGERAAKRADELSEEREGALASGASDDLELREALDSLSDKQRAAVYLFYYEGYRVSDVARLLGESESTVKSHLLRARKKLKAFLEDKEQS